MISHDKIPEAFPYLTINPIIGQSGYESISEVHLQLNTDSASIQYHLRNCALDLIFFTITPTIYNTLSLIPFIHPVNLGSDIIIPDGSNGPRIADICLQFNTSTRI